MTGDDRLRMRDLRYGFAINFYEITRARGLGDQGSKV
jgi:hypothetical protein